MISQALWIYGNKSQHVHVSGTDVLIQINYKPRICIPLLPIWILNFVRIQNTQIHVSAAWGKDAYDDVKL